MLGVRDLKNIALPTAWDGNELSRLRLRDGTTWEQVVRDIDEGLSLVNENLTSGYLGKLLDITTDVAVEYRSGGTNGFEQDTENVQPDRQFADTSGHMLPLRGNDRAMGWTAKVLENIRRVTLEADVSALAEDAIDLFEKRVWTRFFKKEEETGKGYGLGATGVSVGMADGGAGTIDYIPPPRKDRIINAFSTAHNHYLALNGITQANLETAVAHLWEHGWDGPYELIISRADLAAWQNTTNVTGFKPKGSELIQYGGLTDLAIVDGEIYEGVVQTKYGTVMIYANSRIPTGYWAVTKSFGRLDPRNPLKVRYDEMKSFGVRLVVDNVTRYPFNAAIGQFEFGVGTGESRISAVLVDNDSDGTYESPTIT